MTISFLGIMKNLVIVESPAKAKTIEKFLGKNYAVMASFGHIRDLPQSKLGVDLENNFAPQYVIPADKKKTITALKEKVKQLEPEKIYIATDEDREGEAIGWHLMEVLGLKPKQYDRIVFHEITKSAIESSLKHPRKINDDLVDAQQARRVLDRLVGYKLSPLLWKKIAKGLSAGRVQSVAVRLIVEREREIRAFVPQEYWKIVAQLEHEDTKFKAELAKIRNEALKIPAPELKKGVWVSSKEQADDILAHIKQARHFIVDALEVKKGSKNPSPPFTTSTLQQEASRKLGFSVKQTMVVAQKLYEGVDLGEGRTGLITYMRTDSVNLSQQALQQAREVISHLYGKEYALTEPRFYKTKAKGAQEAHEAIRPVNLDLKPDDVKEYLDRNELRLYELIWKRTLACQMAPAAVENTTLFLFPENSKEYQFQAKGEVILFPGFMKVYMEGRDDEEESDEAVLPKLQEGTSCDVLDVTGNQNFTKPEPRYTEASLVKKLESEGIGRPSTYAPTISTIIERNYTEKREKYLYPTEMGELVTDFLLNHFADIVDYKFTAEMEESLDTVAEGKKDWRTILKGFYEPFEKNLVKKEQEVARYQEQTDEICDKCGHPMIIKMGRYGKFLACSNYPECKNIKNLKNADEEVPTTDEKCETCSSSLVFKKGRFGAFWACSKYPECKFTKPIVTKTGFTCPECKQGDVIERKGKRGKPFYGCSRYPDCKFVSWKKPLKQCSACSNLMVQAKKGILKCNGCGTEEEQPGES